MKPLYAIIETGKIEAFLDGSISAGDRQEILEKIHTQPGLKEEIMVQRILLVEDRFDSDDAEEEHPGTPSPGTKQPAAGRYDHSRLARRMIWICVGAALFTILLYFLFFSPAAPFPPEW